MMASKSRAAQEQLQALEKEEAPFNDQLVEAAKFVGTNLKDLRRFCEGGSEGEDTEKRVIYYGREEWLLRWLLKRLQAPKDEIPRQTPSSWWLFAYLVRNIPLVNVAQILVERKFIGIVQLAVEEADKREVNSAPLPEAGSESSSTERGSPENKSKKRKRSGEVFAKSTSTDQAGLPDLIAAIFAAVNCVIEGTKTTSKIIEQGRSSAFVAEYMKTVVRTSAEDAAKILGSWLSLCHKVLSVETAAEVNSQNWLIPFIEVWQCHTAEESQWLHFSLHSTKPLLSLLVATRGRYSNLKWTSQLEKLVAHNIIVPAKTAFSTNADAETLISLTRISVLQDSVNADILFDIAIRCTQSPGGRKRRRAQDDTWLATVFSALRSNMSNKKTDVKTTRQMLASAVKYKVSIDLPVLREIVWGYGLSAECNDWRVIASVLKLDGNAFLIPDEKELLKEVLTRITKTAAHGDWIDASGSIAEEILVPLMVDFAKARDLSGFIRHWCLQLSEFERLRRLRSTEMDTFLANLFSPWEDEALQAGLKKLFEPSLTIPQITQILDWLQIQVSEHPYAVCVILDAIAGSISGDEHVVDAVGLRIYHIMFDNGAADSLDKRYRWRSWRIISRTLAWVEHWQIDELSLMWGQGKKPFDKLLNKDSYKQLFEESDHSSETLEILALACSAWEAADAEKEGRIKPLATNLLGEYLKSFAKEINDAVTSSTHEMLHDENLIEVDDFRKSSEKMGSGWHYLSFARCLFVEHPRALELGLVIEGLDFKNMLQNIFWIASTSYREDDCQFEWLNNHSTVYPNLWRSALNTDSPIYPNKKLLRTLIDIMLNSIMNTNNPLAKEDSKNEFATHCLHGLSAEDFSKAQREQIMQSWSTSESTVLDLSVLALKVKIMRHPAIYEGMRFKDIIELAKTLAGSTEEKLAGPDISFQPQDNLALLKELTRLVFVAAHANMDQKRNMTYTKEAFKAIQKKVNKASKKKPLDYALIGIIEVALVAFHGKEMTLNDHDIILRDDLESVTSTFREALMIQLRHLLAHNDGTIPTQLSVLSVIDALSSIGADASQLTSLNERTHIFSICGNKGLNTQSRLKAFLAIHGPEDSNDLNGEIITIKGRESIIERAEAATKGKDNHQRLELLQEIMTNQPSSLDCLDVLLAVRQIITSIKEERGQNDEESGPTLSAAYTTLAEYLPKVNEIRQFCLIIETLELMLKTKGHSMSQYNIDCAIGAITFFCSSQSPAFKTVHAGTIYSHLCRLMQTVLMHHRLKLQGHTHLAQQAMQALLRCLFVPTNPSGSSSVANTKVRFASPPSWLQPLTLSNAQQFAKLLLLIADPPLSTLSQGRTNPLVSLKDKAKRMSAQWTKYVVQEYIWLQLDMNVRMEVEIREALMQGWFAVLETMNETGRDAMRGEMDSGGRAIFRGLFEEWRRDGGRRE